MCIICLAPQCEFEDPASSAAAGGTTADSFQTVTVSIPDPSDAYGIETGEIWEDPVLTYGFPDSADAYIGVFTYYGEQNGYLPLSAGGQEMVSYAMAQWDAVSGVSLTLAADESTADIRVAGSTYPSTAWAYSPDNAGTAAGDVWIGVDQSYNALFTRDDEPYVGSYEYYVSLHEIGHSLGLKHPHEAKPTNSTTVSSEYDAIEYTVMSYRSYVGSSTSYLTPADGHYPQSLMMLDIAAIQSIYGADYTTLSGDTVYTFNPLTGEMLVDGVSTPETVANVVFRTLWDGDGNDTIDLSAYTTDMSVDLTPGSAIILDTNGNKQRAQLGYDSNGAIYAQANIYMSLLANGDTRSLIENATGGSGNDILQGNVADNILIAGAGDDMISGDLGADTLTGGAGADLFIDTFAGLDGDTITDFDITEDRLVITDAVASEITFSYDASTDELSLLSSGVVKAVITLPLANDLTLPSAVASATDGVEIVFTDTTVLDTPVNLVGGYSTDTLIGGSADDSFLIRFGNDIATGLGGADDFIIDWRYVNGGETFTITDLDFSEGDQLTIRFFNGASYTISSSVDLAAFIGLGTVTDTGSGLLLDDGTTQLTLTFGDPIDTTPAATPMVINGGGSDENLEGGDGDDTILMRFGNDTATGNGGADDFIVDWRYVNGGETFTITDLDFSEGDILTIRFFEGASYRVTGDADLTNLIQQPNITQTTNGILLTDSNGMQLNVDLISTQQPSLSTEPLVLNGGSGNDSLEGADGDDTILMRFGNDIATGHGGADDFIIDWRYVSGGETFTITDLDFSEGDQLKIRFFEGSTSYTVSDSTDLATLATWSSVTQTQTGLIITDSDGVQVTVDFGTPTNTAPSADPVALHGGNNDDFLVGGAGNDSILMRFGDDTATGNAGADDFIADWRYVNGGETFTITDLDFSEGDRLTLRFFDGDSGSVVVSNSSDLTQLIGWDEVTQTDTGLLITDSTGMQLALELDLATLL